MQFTFVALALATLAVANPTPGGPSSPGNQCNTGSLQCCNSVQAANSAQVTNILTGLLGAVLVAALGPLTGQAGVTCTPITVIGTGGTSCNEQPVCCTDNNFNGLVALGCTPINLNL